MRPATALMLLCAVASPTTARAALTLAEGKSGSLTLGGYAYELAGVQILNFELAPESADLGLPSHLGLSETILRLEWKASLGDHVTVEVHQRLFLRVNSEPLASGGEKLGLGASVAPRRTLDLRSAVYDEDRLLFEHDIDRLVLRANLGDFDISLGRQAITWGEAELFPIADLWSTFSPYELDTSQKRGIDALRVLYSHSRTLELEAVVADRGTLRDLSGGLRVATYGKAADFYFAVAKQWRAVLAFVGVSATAGSFKLRAEAAEPFDLDRSEFSPPRVSVGADWLGATLTVTLEAHYNGTGVLRASEYASHLSNSTAIAHGESYLLGRWYAGAAATWKISELFKLAISAIGNLQDPSAIVVGAFTYQLTQETDLSLGAYQGVGKSPLLGTTPELRSELGSAGGLYYLALSSFF
jgi:hypothetical protein